MRLSTVFAVSVLLLAAKVLTASAGDPPRCSHGPGYWCSSGAAARQCGAMEFCLQLRQRTAGQFGGQIRPKASSDEASSACSLFQTALSDTERALQAHRPETEIAQLIKSYLPRDQLDLETVDALESLIDIYLPETVLALRSGGEPKQLCHLLTLCNQSAVALTGPSAPAAKLVKHPLLLLLQLQAPPKVAAKSLSSMGCQSCRTLVEAARQLVRDGRPQAEVAQLLKATACRLPTGEAERVECSSAIDKYLPIMFELLSTELDPIIVCQTLSACQQLQSPSPPPTPPTLTSRRPNGARAGPQCLLCEFVIREAERQLDTDRRSGPAIEAALNEVCSSLPQSARSQCGILVQRRGPIIVRLLVNGLSPRLVCSAVGLCSAVHRPLTPAKWMLAYQRATGGSRRSRQYIGFGDRGFL